MEFPEKSENSTSVAPSGIEPLSALDDDLTAKVSLSDKTEGMENEAASQVGFTSSSYFAKCFKARFGVLPKEFLKQ